MSTLPPPPSTDLTPLDGSTPRRARLPIVAAIVVGLAVAAGIAAIAQRSSDGVDADRGSASTTPSPSEPPMPVTDLEGQARPYGATLNWSAGADPLEGTRYEIRRDGSFVAYVEPPSHRFADDDVQPGGSYLYEVRVETQDGLFSDAESVRVETPLPPEKEARLQGTFDVRSAFVSKVGYGTYTTPGFGWRFKPTCGEGACAVQLRDITRNDLRIRLRRSGGTYAGSFRGRIGLECSGTPTISSVTLTLRVDEAKVIDGEWRVARFVGTLQHEEVAQLGCRSSSAELSLKARLYD